MKISLHSVSRVLLDDSCLRGYKQYTGHLLTVKLKEIWHERLKKLLKEFGSSRYMRILFTDEKIFTTEEKFNKRNDRVYGRLYHEAREKVPRVQWGHHPAYVMVWWGISYAGATEILFCKHGVKMLAKVYQRMFKNVVKFLNSALFQNRPWVFQQDSAPGCKAKSTRTWLEGNVPAFICAENWPSSSPNLNPLDYRTWQLLVEKACAKAHHTVEALRVSIKKAAAKIPLQTLCTCIDEFPDHLRPCITVAGEYFE